MSSPEIPFNNEANSGGKEDFMAEQETNHVHKILYKLTNVGTKLSITSL